MMSAAFEKLYTVKEYLELEKHSEVRHEYYYGKLINMPSESKTPNRIMNNILAEWRKPLLSQNCECYTNDVKAETVSKSIFRYPDLVVASQEDEEDDFIIKQPIIMVEVASSDSWKRDTLTKKKEYTALPTMQYYLIVSQEEMYVEFYYRKGKEWINTVYENPKDIVSLPLYNLKITLTEIYDRVKFGDFKSVKGE